jgi:hypothetical protein
MYVRVRGRVWARTFDGARDMHDTLSQLAKLKVAMMYLFHKIFEKT